VTGSGRLRAGLKLNWVTAVLIRTVLITGWRGFFIAILLGIDLHDANAAIVRQYLHAIHLTASALHRLGAQNFTAGLAFHPANRIGQTRFALDTGLISIAIPFAIAFALVSRCWRRKQCDEQNGNREKKTLHWNSVMSRAFRANQECVEFGGSGVNPI